MKLAKKVLDLHEEETDIDNLKEGDEIKLGKGKTVYTVVSFIKRKGKLVTVDLVGDNGRTRTVFASDKDFKDMSKVGK